MKTTTIFILLLCVPLFALADYQENDSATTEVEFSDPDIENLPPVEEMTGVIITDTVYTEKKDTPYTEKDEGIQPAHGTKGIDITQTHTRSGIQPAHGTKCRRRHGHRGCKRHLHPHHPVHPPHVPYPPSYNFHFVGNVCRSGLFFCYLNFPGPIGVPCQCYDHFGNIWLRGLVTPY